MRKKRRPYPAKHRKKLAEICRKDKPWTHATGPKTPEGKAASAKNALKHGLRSAEFIQLRAVLKAQRDFMKTVLGFTEASLRAQRSNPGLHENSGLPRQPFGPPRNDGQTQIDKPS